MNVICKRSSKKTKVGASYRVLLLRNSPGNSYPRIIIDINNNPGSYTPKSFSMPNGDPILAIDYQSTDFVENMYSYIDDNVKIGDYVIYSNNNSKHLDKMKIYQVEDVNIIKHKYYSEIFLKVKGYNRWIKSTNFKKISDQESRDMNISIIMDDETPVTKVDEKVRKFDRLGKEEQFKLLISTLSNSMSDPYRNNMSILDWACDKLGKVYGLTKSDFDLILNKNLKSIIREVK